jgi:hypothetical protein
MKSSIESNGKEHKVILTAENVFEQSVINAVQVYQTKANIYKRDSKALDISNKEPPKYDQLVIEMKDGN